MDEGAWKATVHAVVKSRTHWVTFTHMILKRSSQLISDVLIQFYLYLASIMPDSLWPHGLYSPWNSPGQNTGVGSRSLLQGIFPAQGSNPGLWHCRRILYQLSHQGSPIFIQKNDEQRKGIESEKRGRGEEGNRQQQVRGGRGEEAFSSFLRLLKWSRSVMSTSLRPHGLQPTRLLCPWDFPGKSTGVGVPFPSRGIFPTQGWNSGLLHCRQTLYPLSHQGSSQATGGYQKHFRL